MSSKQSGLRALMAVALILGLVSVWNNFVIPVLAAVEANDANACADAVFYDLLGICGLVAVLIGTFMTMVPAVIRRRKVGRELAEPGTLFMTARGNIELRRVLDAGHFFIRRQVKRNVPGWTFTVSADTAGVCFWAGMFRPEMIVSFKWSEVESISVGRVEVGLRFLPTVSMRMRATEAAAVTLSFALGGEGLLTAFPRRKNAVDATVQALEVLRLAGIVSRQGLI